MANSTNSPLEIKQTVSAIESEYDPKFFLQKTQFVVLNYLVKSASRGILLYHSPGQGKSITAAAIADYYRHNDPGRKIIILLAKSLQGNFEKNIRKYMRNRLHGEPANPERSPEAIERALGKYKFVSLNASNMFAQLKQIKKTAEQIEFEKAHGISSARNFLEGSLLIVDEFHNLSNSVTNQSKNAVQLYQQIMRTKDIKLVFMTGTPIVNNPFELVPTFNMLRGYLDTRSKATLFPENREEFESFFVDAEAGAIKNKGKFQNRIFGMVSYAGDFYVGAKQSADFPEQKPLIVEVVPMSFYQFGRYESARELERKEESRKFSKGARALTFSVREENGKSSYRIRTRQICNYFIPDYALTFTGTGAYAKVAKHIKKIKPADLADLDKHSPKFAKIIENIDRHKNQLGVVYSEFVSGEGLGLFGITLEQAGWKFWEKSNQFLEGHEDPGEYSYDAETTKLRKMDKTYALITGDVPPAVRDNIVSVFNSRDNMHGNIISLLLISKSGAEGLSLQNVRHIHIMEPFWNYARIEQVTKRGVRFQSHMRLKPSERNVQPYLYISTYPTGYDKELIKERTTDEELFFLSSAGRRLNDDFSLALIETSIDCSMHYTHLDKDVQSKLKCRMCKPNDRPLFDIDYYKDIHAPDACEAVVESEVQAHEIIVTINGEPHTFYYTRDGQQLKIYTYSDMLAAYVPLKKNHPAYPAIVQKLM